MRKIITIDRIPPILRTFKVGISCPTTAQMETWVVKVMTSRRELLETFPLALTGVKSSSENFFFYTSYWAFKFPHKEICPLVKQVLSVAILGRFWDFFYSGLRRGGRRRVWVEWPRQQWKSRRKLMANADKPLADEEWLRRYNEEVKQNEELERMLQKRLDGTEHVDSW